MVAIFETTSAGRYYFSFEFEMVFLRVKRVKKCATIETCIVQFWGKADIFCHSLREIFDFNFFVTEMKNIYVWVTVTMAATIDSVMSTMNKLLFCF